MGARGQSRVHERSDRRGRRTRKRSLWMQLLSEKSRNLVWRDVLRDDELQRAVVAIDIDHDIGGLEHERVDRLLPTRWGRKKSDELPGYAHRQL